MTDRRQTGTGAVHMLKDSACSPPSTQPPRTLLFSTILLLFIALKLFFSENVTESGPFIIKMFSTPDHSIELEHLRFVSTVLSIISDKPAEYVTSASFLHGNNFTVQSVFLFF